MDELGRLNESGRKLYVDIGALLTLLNDSATNFVKMLRGVLQKSIIFHPWRNETDMLSW